MSKKPESARFESGYCDKAWTRPGEIIEDAKRHLRGVKYDTLVGTGLSGALVVPVLARALRKKLLICRKDEDRQSSHSGREWLGELGERWVFVDDFISSGATYGRVRDSVDRAVEDVNRWKGSACGLPGCSLCEPDPAILFKTELVGVFTYNGGGGFTRWRQ